MNPKKSAGRGAGRVLAEKGGMPPGGAGKGTVPSFFQCENLDIFENPYPEGPRIEKIQSREKYDVRIFWGYFPGGGVFEGGISGSLNFVCWGVFLSFWAFLFPEGPRIEKIQSREAILKNQAFNTE